MSGKTRFAYVGGVAGMVAIGVVVLFVGRAPNSIRGAVVTHAEDPARQLPIDGVEITMIAGLSTKMIAGLAPTSAHSDAGGFFNIPIPWHLRRGQQITLVFNHPGYQALDLADVSGDRLCIAQLFPLDRKTTPASQAGEVSIGHVVVKYSISTTTTVNVGSAVKTFQAVNTGNLPCDGRHPCSPDGKWKAAEGSAVIDAGPGNEFHNARASCIAGPCPFTKIGGDGIRLSQDGRKLSVSALNWSDTATFLLEAEVYKPMVSDVSRHSYPLIFDRALTFTLPASAEGVSIESEFDGKPIVFPLGPALLLSWADCQMLVNKDKTRVYRCELKPGYQFSASSVNSRDTN